MVRRSRDRRSGRALRHPPSQSHRMQLFREDLAERRALGVARDLPFGGVALGDREEVGRAELLRDRPDPVDELLETRPRSDGSAAVEVDELTREAVADRAPEVL